MPADADFTLMRRLDELHLEFSFAGSRTLRTMLAAEGRPLGRRHISTLMRRMGIEALYRRRRTTKPERRRGAGLRPDATRSIRIFCAA